MTGRRRAVVNWLDFVATLLGQPLTELPAKDVALHLIAALDSEGCAHTSAGDAEWRSAMWPPEFWGGPDGYDNAEIAARESSHSHPVVQFYAATGRTEAMQTADVPSRFHDRWRARGLESYYRSVGVPHHLSLPLQISATGHVAFVLGRARAYDEVEMAVARAAQRLLRGLEGQARALRSASTGTAVVDAVDAGLSPREHAVLLLLSDGLTASAIGRRLAIAPSTVHKHLGNVYAKLEVHDRLSAVRRAQHLGLLPVPRRATD